MPPDLLTLDPATLKAGPTTDAMVAEWRGWRPCYAPSGDLVGWFDDNDDLQSAIPDTASHWSPSTNFAHAIEAMLKASWWRVTEILWSAGPSIEPTNIVGVECKLGLCPGEVTARVSYKETNGNKAEAMALATCRAIVAAMVAKEKVGKEGK